MTKSYITLIGVTAIASSALFLMSNGPVIAVNAYHNNTNSALLNSSGATSARTGAPGESTCTQCHSGAAQDGNNVTDLILAGGGTDFTPGDVYSMTLTMTNGANKNGFQLVALDENDDMAGSFTITDVTNTKLISNTGLGRDYITHTSSGTSLSSWSFDWGAPAQAENVTFYVATNRTNSNNGSTGDEIYLSSHSFANGSLSIDGESLNTEQHFSAGYSPSSHSIIVDFGVNILNQKVSINLLDLSGKSIFFNNEGAFNMGNHTQKVRLPESINNGIYVVTLFVGNQPYSAKIMVNR
jgi:hypothetical protein